MDNGWICMHRKILDWEWYGDSKMFHLFFHLCASANYEDSQWRGRVVKKGQLITGRKKLSSETGISEKSVRTCLNRLVKSGEITKEGASKFTIITVCNYDKYQHYKYAEGPGRGQEGARMSEKNLKKGPERGHLQVIDIAKDSPKKSQKYEKRGQEGARKSEKKVGKRATYKQ